MNGAGGVQALHRAGWEIVRLQTDDVEVDVVPGKGGDLVALRWRALDLDVLWPTPWGLRQRGVAPVASDSTARWLEQYPGGWQTIFPNGGDPADIGGVQQPFHGEACQVPWSWREVSAGDAAVELRTRLFLSPFTLQRRLSLAGATLSVEETVINVGAVPLGVMWAHHPAFGPPFLSGDCTLECGATWFEADDARTAEHAELRPGARTRWPEATRHDGIAVDLSRIPADDARTERMGYLGGFERGWAAITNHVLGLRVALRWDESVMPYAWHWLDVHGTTSHPWFGQAHVLAIEPATSYPVQGAQVAQNRGTLFEIGAGEERVVRIEVELSQVAEGQNPR